LLYQAVTWIIKRHLNYTKTSFVWRWIFIYFESFHKFLEIWNTT